MGERPIPCRLHTESTTVTTLDFIDATVPQAFEADYAEMDVLGMLRRVSNTIDLLWRSALTQGTGEVALKLGEASHGVHRALIALTPPTPR